MLNLLEDLRVRCLESLNRKLIDFEELTGIDPFVAVLMIGLIVLFISLLL